MEELDPGRGWLVDGESGLIRKKVKKATAFKPLPLAALACRLPYLRKLAGLKDRLEGDCFFFPVNKG